MKRISWIAAMMLIIGFNIPGSDAAPASESSVTFAACQPDNCVTVNGCSIQCARCARGTEDGGVCEWP
jgi:hypothetical protein